MTDQQIAPQSSPHSLGIHVVIHPQNRGCGANHAYAMFEFQPGTGLCSTQMHESLNTFVLLGVILWIVFRGPRKI